MRLAAAALCVLALTGSAEARYLKPNHGDPCAVVLPKTIVHPSVKFDVFNLTPKEMLKMCSSGAPNDLDPSGIVACTFEQSPGYWPIYVSNAMTMEETGCLVQYEMAHMPPNYWGDPKMERPEAIEWLAEQRGKR